MLPLNILHVQSLHSGSGWNHYVKHLAPSATKQQWSKLLRKSIDDPYRFDRFVLFLLFLSSILIQNDKFID